MFQWLYTLLKAECILTVPKGGHFTFHTDTLRTVFSLLQAEDTLTASGLQNFTNEVISHSNSDQTSDLTVRVLDEESSQAVINAPCYSELQDLMCYVDSHTPEYSPIPPPSAPMQTTCSNCINSLNTTFQHQQDRKSAKNVEKINPPKKIYSEPPLIPEKAQSKYDLPNEMQTVSVFILPHLSRVRNQWRSNDYMHHSLDLFPETMPPDAILPLDQQDDSSSHGESTHFCMSYVTRTSHARNLSSAATYTDASTMTIEFYSSSIPIAQSPSQDVQFDDATPSSTMQPSSSTMQPSSSTMQPPSSADAARHIPILYPEDYLKKDCAKSKKKCPTCGYTAQYTSQMICHTASHTEEKPHVCKICKKGFSLITNLRRHLRTHTGEKPFKCAFCPKEYTQSHNLKKHIMKHTERKLHKRRL